MRRSRSQLKNLSAPGARGAAPAQQPFGGNRHAEEIQRRINALGAISQPYGEPDYSGYSAAPVQGGQQIYGHPADMPGAYGHANPNTYAYPNPAQFHPPMYADMPMPAHSAPMNPELDVLKSHIDRMSGKLADVERMSANGIQQGSQQISELVGQNIGALTAQINDLSNAVSGIASNQPGKDDINGFRKALEDASRAFSEFSGGSASSGIDPDAYAKVVEQSHQTLAGEIEQMRQSLSSTNGNSDIYAKTLEASHDDLKAQMALLQQTISDNLEVTGEEVGRLQQSHTSLLSEIETIKTLIHDTGNQSNGVGTEDISNIEMRLEEITRAIVAISHGGTNVDQMERLEARISDLSRSLTSGEGAGGYDAASGDFQEIKAQLLQMGEQLAGVSQQPTVTVGSDWAAAIEALHDKLDNMQAIGSASTSEGYNNDQLLERLDDLVERVGPASSAEEINRLSQEVSNFGALLANTSGSIGSYASAGEGTDLSGLEAKLTEIVEHLQGDHGTPDMSAVQEKLTSIEEQVASSRDIAIELANQAAMDAVNQAMQHFQDVQPTSGETVSGNEILNELANDIRTLQQNSSQNSSDTLQTFDALKDTLEHMVGRLATIEESLKSAPMTPAIPSPSPEPQPMAAQSNIAAEQAYEAMDAYAEPAPVQSYSQPQASNTSDQYDALLAESVADSQPEPVVAPQRQSVAQALVEEANRAEELRLRQRSSQQAYNNGNSAAENDREFNSSELAADTFEAPEPVQQTLPEHRSPELDVDTFPTVSVQNDTHMPAQSGMDETPLEPGSGGPDLAALVRQANERRKTLAKNGAETSGTDFIAAARRAAQAAAEEATAAQEAPTADDQPESKGLMSALPDLFGKRKKALAMAAGVALLAAIAIPIAGSLMGPDKPSEIAQATEPVNTQTQASQAKLDADSDVRVVEVIEADNTVEQFQTASLNQDASQFDAPTQTSAFSFAGDLEFGNDALKSSVEAGDPAALFEVGRRYMEGHGTQKNVEKAALWYGRAADKGFAPAQYLIGNFGEKGIATERDTASAVSWYKKAAGNGNIVAMHNLAVLHATPNGASEQPDLPEAFSWFKQAAQYGVRDSQVNLGIFYTKGVGTEVDLIEAYKWFTLAAKAGDKDAENKRDVVADALRPDQLAEAKTRVEGWKPTEAIQIANTVSANSEWTKDLASAPLPATKTVVAKTQILLSKIGYDAGPADGIMGQKTRDAILQFQQRVGLSISGEITAELLRELEAVAI